MMSLLLALSFAGEGIQFEGVNEVDGSPCQVVIQTDGDGKVLSVEGSVTLSTWALDIFNFGTIEKDIQNSALTTWGGSDFAQGRTCEAFELALTDGDFDGDFTIEGEKEGTDNTQTVTIEGDQRGVSFSTRTKGLLFDLVTVGSTDAHCKAAD